MTLSHRPVWMDLATHSGRDIASFYNAVCGWDAAEGSSEFGGYFMFMSNGVPMTGAMPTPADQPGGWTTYIQVDDVPSTLEQITAAGGFVFAGPIPIADLGSMAIVADPSGCPFGLWAPETFTGFPLDGRSGSPVWFELYTKDYEGSKAFFAKALGWNFDIMSNTDEFKYATVSIDGDQVVGIMDFSAEMHASMPGYWNSYFHVADCDEAAAAALKEGGNLLMSPTDTPFGRMASIKDRNGAIFSVVKNND